MFLLGFLSGAFHLRPRVIWGPAFRLGLQDIRGATTKEANEIRPCLFCLMYMLVGGGFQDKQTIVAIDSFAQATKETRADTKATAKATTKATTKATAKATARTMAKDSKVRDLMRHLETFGRSWNECALTHAKSYLETCYSTIHISLLL